MWFGLLQWVHSRFTDTVGVTDGQRPRGSKDSISPEVKWKETWASFHMVNALLWPLSSFKDPWCWFFNLLILYNFGSQRPNLSELSLSSACVSKSTTFNLSVPTLASIPVPGLEASRKCWTRGLWVVKRAVSNPFLIEHSLNSPPPSALSAGWGYRKGITEGDTTKKMTVIDTKT